MFLMFHELRPDVLPVDDLGLQKAMATHYSCGTRAPTRDAMLALAEPWRPWRSVATWYLWRSLEPVPVDVLARRASRRVAAGSVVRGLRTMARWTIASAAPYAGLTPDCVLDALDAVGLFCDGRLLALNSYENRVYQAWLDDRASRSARYGGIGRRQVLSSVALERRADRRGACVRRRARRARDPCRGADCGRRRDLASLRRLPLRGLSAMRRSRSRTRGSRDARMDRTLRRPHPRRRREQRRSACGRRSTSRVSATSLARGCSRNDFIPADLRAAWESVSAQAVDGVRRCYERAGEVSNIRLHGDCHAGNVLWRTGGPMQGPHFVDFDDCRSGPAIQDLWMLLSGDREDMRRQLRWPCLPVTRTSATSTTASCI